MKEAIEKWLSQFSKECNENTYTPKVKIQSTVDEGKHLTNIERKQHLYYEIKNR